MAPVLALLDDVPGVDESRVDWTGRFVLLKLQSGASTEAIVANADEILGGDVRRLDAHEEAEAIASYRRGDQWMRSGETRRLSREEARVIANRDGREAGREAGLTDDQTERFVAIMETEIAAAFGRIHDEGKGLPRRFDATFRDVVSKTLEKSATFLSEAQRHAIEDYFASLGDN